MNTLDAYQTLLKNAKVNTINTQNIIQKNNTKKLNNLDSLKKKLASLPSDIILPKSITTKTNTKNTITKNNTDIVKPLQKPLSFKQLMKIGKKTETILKNNTTLLPGNHTLKINILSDNLISKNISINQKYDQKSINTKYDQKQLPTRYDQKQIQTRYDQKPIQTKYDQKPIQPRYDPKPVPPKSNLPSKPSTSFGRQAFQERKTITKLKGNSTFRTKRNTIPDDLVMLNKSKRDKTSVADLQDELRERKGLLTKNNDVFDALSSKKSTSIDHDRSKTTQNRLKDQTQIRQREQSREQRQMKPINDRSRDTRDNNRDSDRSRDIRRDVSRDSDRSRVTRDISRDSDRSRRESNRESDRSRDPRRDNYRESDRYQSRDPPRKIKRNRQEYSEDDESLSDHGRYKQSKVSSIIQNIFGYNRNRYHDEDEDSSDMEAGLEDVIREEKRSSRIGKMEDMEEERRELEREERLRMKRQRR
ncbi:hypothetical protein BC833DRAFT_581192 [Globomyces pollinis-pini]|nr:hypothetical protein BC833DRAFT_581192 [Globomyces pollinis-pini]